ncbi:hypothetical protein TGDOM2_290740 [Toxoplasma gondii GAB2-2007-GAL-DOM2]|uniref:Transmembrane protein n=3 Tax=Toxoplasma gondii TaxID=5811 RepID=S7UQB2_TOXGG|nr:hypothetical protein TGGT1_290740 [Toxoplasma gondii GT1]KFG42320.1 hypothetical protein TGDOM2_290740 [Toxoplasma gondii GAB2-2007-GAL-DOM2]RQX73654.1 hypothetical protein TGCAST_290740 [Toxoplasma gondii CAST]
MHARRDYSEFILKRGYVSLGSFFLWVCASSLFYPAQSARVFRFVDCRNFLASCLFLCSFFEIFFSFHLSFTRLLLSPFVSLPGALYAPLLCWTCLLLQCFFVYPVVLENFCFFLPARGGLRVSPRSPLRATSSPCRSNSTLVCRVCCKPKRKMPTVFHHFLHASENKDRIALTEA